MAVKNGGQIMREAIDSILNQTFTDFEFIIINDGSTDETLEVLAEYKDPRIQVYSQENQGLARTLNRGLCLALGKYIARQDHDDISLPTRLEKQLAYLEAHPKCGLLGTAAEIWTGKEPSGRYHDHPTVNEILKIEMLFDNPFVNTSTLFRKSIIRDIGLYNPTAQITPLDDFDFISRVSHKYEVANLPERLVIYRETNNSLTSSFRDSATLWRSTLQTKLAKVTSMNLAFLLNMSSENKKIIAWGNLVSMNKSRGNNIKFVNLKELFTDACEKVRLTSGSLAIEKIQPIKIDHLEYLWYTNPGVADWHEKKFFFIKKNVLEKLTKLSDICQSVMYRIKIRIRIRLLKIKQWFLRDLHDN
jgi:glycosyltransferase involved in cell wall biosynthesis